jgi:hypothetical protein
MEKELLQAEIRGLSAAVEGLKKRVREMEALWDREIPGRLNGELAELRSELNGRLGAIEARLSQVERRFLDSL